MAQEVDQREALSFAARAMPGIATTREVLEVGGLYVDEVFDAEFAGGVETG